MLITRKTSRKYFVRAPHRLEFIFNGRILNLVEISIKLVFKTFLLACHESNQRSQISH